MFPLKIQLEVDQFKKDIAHYSQSTLQELSILLFTQLRTNEYVTELVIDDMIRENEQTQQYLEMFENAKTNAQINPSTTAKT